MNATELDKTATSISPFRISAPAAGPAASGTPSGHLPSQGDPEIEEIAMTWTTYGEGFFEVEVCLLPEDDGTFSALAARLPGVGAQGDDPELAIFELSRALHAVLSSYKDRGVSIPWTHDQLAEGCDSEEVERRWIVIGA